MIEKIKDAYYKVVVTLSVIGELFTLFSIIVWGITVGGCVVGIKVAQSYLELKRNN